MTRLGSYGPPGGLQDLDDVGLKAWHTFISDSVDSAMRGPDPGQVRNDSPRPQFYNLTETETGPDATEAAVTWTAFPRVIQIGSLGDQQRWQRADADRDVQDEYCEWSVTRDDAGRVLRVTFTCEGPEYWDVLAQTNPHKALALYRQHIGPDVREEDLFNPDGSYIRRNKWNDSTTRGAMHLTQRANTLAAEIELAAAATNRRIINGRELTSAQELIACGRFGEPDRHSDPHIGEVVNSVARQAADLTLADPVGLYFDGLSTAGWQTPDASDPHGYWRYERGGPGHPVRAVYTVPAEAGFTVSDITISGKPIRFGAQLADFITMKLTAVACRFGTSTARAQTSCVQVVSPAETALPADTPSPYGHGGAEPAPASRATRRS